MKQNNNYYKLMITLFLAMFFTASVYSAAGLNVVLANQNPDPVAPGNFVYLNVKVSNIGSDDLKNVKISMVENENFKLAQGSENVKEMGSISSFAGTSDSSNFVIAKYKVLVDPKTPLGLNIIKFNVEQGFTSSTYEFDILVQDINPSIKVSSFKVENLEPGKSSKLVVNLENDNSIDLKNVVLTLSLADVENKVFNTKSGSNQKKISLIDAGKSVQVEFDLIASPNAVAKPYLLPITISFDDALGNSYSSDALGSVQVYSAPQLSVNLDSQESLSGGRGKITFAIANPGTSSIKGTQVEILDSENYDVLEGKFQYIGDLNPDDFQTVQADVVINAKEDTNVLLKVTYSDSYNQKVEEIVEIPVKVFNAAQLKELGIAGATSGSAVGSVVKYVFVIILLVVVYVIGRKRGYSKGKSSRK